MIPQVAKEAVAVCCCDVNLDGATQSACLPIVFESYTFSGAMDTDDGGIVGRCFGE